MLTIRLYWTRPTWTAVAGEILECDGVLFIWSCEKATFDECCLDASNFVARYMREHRLDLDQLTR